MTDPRTPTDERGGPPQGIPPQQDERQDAKLPYGRRRRTAASALIAMLVALLLGALFNAPAMKKTALEMPFGGERSFRLALVDPLAAVSHWFFLDRPAQLTASVLGKADPGPRGTSSVVVVPTPTPTKGGDKPGQKGDKPQKTLQEKPLPKPFKGHPMHLYIAGDSMMGLPGMALTNLSNKTKLIKPLLDYHISTGLVRPDFFNWPAQVQQQVEAFDPGAVAVMFGANDNQAVQASSGKIYQFGSDGWKKEYRKRAVPGRRAARVLDRPAGDALVVVQRPGPADERHLQERGGEDLRGGVHRRLRAALQGRRVHAVPAGGGRQDRAGPRAGRGAPDLRRRADRRPGRARRDQEGVVREEGRGTAALAQTLQVGHAGALTHHF
jgi:hypothetical protein